MVNCAGRTISNRHMVVIDGASDLFYALWGPGGIRQLPRAAVGIAGLRAAAGLDIRGEFELTDGRP